MKPLENVGETSVLLHPSHVIGTPPDHELRIEKVLPFEAGKRYPVCLTGKRACPPEDCGGIWGYAGFLDAIHDPQHPEHEEMVVSVYESIVSPSLSRPKHVRRCQEGACKPTPPVRLVGVSGEVDGMHRQPGILTHVVRF